MLLLLLLHRHNLMIEQNIRNIHDGLRFFLRAHQLATYANGDTGSVDMLTASSRLCTPNPLGSSNFAIWEPPGPPSIFPAFSTLLEPSSIITGTSLSPISFRTNLNSKDSINKPPSTTHPTQQSLKRM